MIAERVPPQPVFHPKGAVQQRVVLLGRPQSNQMRASRATSGARGAVTWWSSSQMNPPRQAG